MAKSALDASYFQGPITIAGKAETGVSAELSIFMTLHEEEYNRLLLGDALYDAYKAGMDLPVIDQEQRFKDLDDWLYKTVSPQVKVSPAANYVYFRYMQANATQTTQGGETLVKQENALNVGNAPKAKMQWNAMAKMGKLIQGRIEAADAYPEYVKPCDMPTGTELERDLFNARMNVISITNPFF